MASGAVALPRLVDSLRLRKLRIARKASIAVGVVLICASTVLFLLAEEMVDRELQKLTLEGVVVPEEERQLAIWIERVFQVGQASVGILLVILGLLIYRAPVFCTVTALSLYAMHWAVCVIADPRNLLRGLLVRVMVIAVLVGAVQTAFAYRRSATRPTKLQTSEPTS